MTTRTPRQAKASLSPKLKRAFARSEIESETPLPQYPRAVRLGIDYTLRVTVDSIETDEQAALFVWRSVVLAALWENDPPGDPPATCVAFDAAEAAGPNCRRAFLLLGMIRDCPSQWRAAHRPVPALPEQTMAFLRQAAGPNRSR